MSHRTAFALSIALALFFAFGVFVGRDRLFARMDAASAPPTTPSRGLLLGGATGGAAAVDVAGASPRIVEIPLSGAVPSEPAWTDGNEDDDRDDDRDDGREPQLGADNDSDEEHDDD